jgi:hypothetical protein
MNIQAVLFPKEDWSSSKARKWLLKHNLKPIKRVYKTEQYLRYRIAKPDKNSRYAIKELSNGVKVILRFDI